MTARGMPLSVFIALAQREVQMVLEYLATRAARQVTEESPALVQASIGKLRMSVPVVVSLVSAAARTAAAPNGGRDTAEEGRPAAGSEVGGQRLPLPGMYELLVATPETCAGSAEHLARIDIELIPCLKRE